MSDWREDIIFNDLKFNFFLVIYGGRVLKKFVCYMEFDLDEGVSVWRKFFLVKKRKCLFFDFLCLKCKNGRIKFLEKDFFDLFLNYRLKFLFFKW